MYTVGVDLVGYFLKLNCSTQVWTILFGIEYKYDIIRVKRLTPVAMLRLRAV